MARPQYETAADREREARVIERITNRVTGSTATKLEYGACADYRLDVAGTPVAYVEVKTRTCSSKTYDTYHISHSKLKSLLSLARKDGVKPLLLVQWTNGAGIIGVDTYLREATLKSGGRRDRNDPYDIEEMAEVSISKFTML